MSQRIRNKFQVSVAEVGDNEAWQVATIGVACVSNEMRHCQAILQEIEEYVRASRLDAEVVDVQADVRPFED